MSAGKTAVHCAGALAGVMLVVLFGCTQRSRFVPPDGGPVSESIVFYESDSGGHREPISQEQKIRKKDDHETLRNRRVDRVANPALVDQDSLIHILIKKDNLTERSSGDFLSEPKYKDLAERKKRLQAVLATLDEMIGMRIETIQAYKAKPDDFSRLKKAYGKKKLAFFEALLALYPDPENPTTPEEVAAAGKFKEIDNRIKKAKKSDPTYKALGGIIQDEIDAVTKMDREIERVAEQLPKLTLRLQAFLHPPGKKPAAIHLEHYDSLGDGQIVRRDRFGLDLSDEEIERLSRQVEATKEIAETANRVKRGELKLRDGFRDIARSLSPDLSALADRIDALASKLESNALATRYDTLKETLEALTDTIETSAEALGEELVARAQVMPQKYVDELKESTTSIGSGLRLVASIRILGDRWKIATGSQLDALIRDSLFLLKGLSTWIRNESPDVLDDAVAELEEFLTGDAQAIEDEVQSKLDSILDSPAMQSLREQVDSILEDIDEGTAIVKEAQRLLGLTDVAPIDMNLRNDAAFDVPLDELKDTYLDLRLTPRSPGDWVTVNAVLLDGTREIDQSTASFEVDRFGWFARLSPAVVLVTPDTLEDDPDLVQFAPTVSWMHHYAPRSTDEAWYAPTLRFLQPSVGIHSAFLAFDSDNPIEIGMGGTLSFWSYRIQLGAGYNLMADEREDGRFYYFIGSDLIGLLQTIGIQGLP